MDRSRLVALLSGGILFSHLISIPLITNIGTGLMLAVTLFDKTIFKKLKTLMANKTFWFLISPFLIFSAATLYSENILAGWKLLEIRLSLFIFPLVFALIEIKRNDFILFLKSAILMIGVIPVVGFINQLGLYNQTGDSGYFYNDNLVSIVEKQAVYYALFINVALVGLFSLWNLGEIKKPTQKLTSILLFVVFIGAQYLLACRTAMLTTILIVLGFVLIILLGKVSKKQVALLMSGILLFILTMTAVFPKVLKRFNSITNLEYKYDNPNPINHFNGEIKDENWNGLNTRLAIWNCAIEEIKKKPIFGDGLGDVQESLMKNYEEKNFILARERNHNTHNQYLDILMSNGILGFIIFFTFLVFLFLKAIKERNWLLLGIVCTFALACLTENILSRNQGVLFISFMISINMINIKKTNEVFNK